MNEKFQKLYEALDNWCALHRVTFDQTCDEDDLQAYLIFNQHVDMVPRLLRHLQSLLVTEGLHNQAVETRAGVVLVFSLNALSEQQLAALRGTPLDLALDNVWTAPLSEVSQYNWSSKARGRYQERFGYERFSGETAKTGQRVLPTRRGRLRTRMPWLAATPGLPPQRPIGDRLAGIMGEDMQGLAAHVQPSQMLKNLDQAMRDAGLHATLDAAGIKNKLSDDRQRIIFYTTTAQGAQQPIIAFDLIQLGEGSKMKEALRSLMDLAQQHAPGEGELQLKHLQDKDRAIGQIADKYIPKQQEADQQMAQPMPALEAFGRRVAAAFEH